MDYSDNDFSGSDADYKMGQSDYGYLCKYKAPIQNLWENQNLAPFNFTTFKIKSKQNRKIIYASLAFNNTVVFLERNSTKLSKKKKKSVLKDYIVHASLENGRILEIYQMPKAIQNFTMISSYEIVIQNQMKNVLEVISLKDHSVKKIRHQFTFYLPDRFSFFSFCQSSIFCLMEKVDGIVSRFKLTYFSSEDKKKITETDLIEYKFSNSPSQVDNHSKICWSEKKEDYFIFYFFHLKTDPKGTLQSIKVKKDLIGLENKQFTSIKILWALAENKYLIFAQEIIKIKQQKINLIADYYLQTIEEGGFKVLECFKKNQSVAIKDLPLKSQDKSFSMKKLQLFKFYMLKQFMMAYLLTTKYEKSSEFFMKGWFLIDLLTMTAQNNKQGFPDCIKLSWDHSTLLSINYKIQTEITITAIRLPFELKFLYMQLLQHSNEDFDDDLYQDAIELLMGDDLEAII